MAYLTVAEYRKIATDPVDLPDNQLERVIRDAERDIDGLTYNRIRAAGGIDSITDYQQGLVREAICCQVGFRAEYGEMLDNPLNSYGINGVSMAWDPSKVVTRGGVKVLSSTLALLQQTGLCCRAL